MYKSTFAMLFWLWIQIRLSYNTANFTCISSDAGAVIHSHSKNAVMATLLYPGKEFRITHMEMIKGIRKDKTGGNLR